MTSSNCKTTLTDEELTKLAVQKILEETEQASRRAELVGPSGWQAKKKSINKNFLNNTMLANAQFNNRKEKH